MFRRFTDVKKKIFEKYDFVIIYSEKEASVFQLSYVVVFFTFNPAMNTPRPSRGTRIESCDFFVLIGDP